MHRGGCGFRNSSPMSIRVFYICYCHWKTTKQVEQQTNKTTIKQLKQNICSCNCGCMLSSLGRCVFEASRARPKAPEPASWSSTIILIMLILIITNYHSSYCSSSFSSSSSYEQYYYYYYYYYYSRTWPKAPAPAFEGSS